MKGEAQPHGTLRHPGRTISAGVLRDIISLQQQSKHFDKRFLNLLNTQQCDRR